MDWSRVKTILIIAFLFTNVFLAYNIYNQHSYSSAVQQRIEEVIEIIDSRGIKINCDIPKDAYIQGTLTVKYREFPHQRVASLLFNGRKVIPVKQDKSVIYVYGDRKLEVKNGKEIIYLDLNLKDKLRDAFSSEEAVNIGTSFLKETGLFVSGMVLDKVTATEKGYAITFAQEYKGSPLEVSFVRMEVTPEGVYSAHMLWLDPVSMEKERKRIIPAAEALLKVIGSEDVSKKDSFQVEDIRLIYYFNWEDAKEGEAFPAWKVFIDGDVYYINALTGQFEK